MGPYSQAIAFGDALYCSGQIALRPEDGELLDGPVEAQVRQCLANLQAICEAAGTSLDQALQVVVYLTDLETFPAMNEVYAQFFTAGPPARATVGVAALPAGAKVEIAATVRLNAG